jgi:endosialidase-like protein
MDSASEAILALKPVTFHYKTGNTGTPQFGLIAEEVAEINPDLVGVRRERRDLHRPLRSGDRDAIKRVSQRTPQGAGSDDHASETGVSVQTGGEQQKQIKARTAGLEKVNAQLEVSPRRRWSSVISNGARDRSQLFKNARANTR